ncbi:MAG: hypothetical protein C0598_12770 [Marinilabiliales bacterium]|nr:MAG: hypothetical protein C0598_12770 [Marinilabiliales bacterium]
MKRLLFLTIFMACLMGSSLMGQEAEETANKPLSVNVDLMSRYVWRGTDYGASPSIQPGISYSLKGFTIGTWGAFTTNNPGVQEVDLYLSYTFLKEMISVTITDYYFPDEVAPGFNYFHYRDSIGHVFEAMLSFNGTEKIPLTFLIATNFYGADAKCCNSDGSTSDKIQYSTYAELGYTYKNINAFIGFNLTNPDTDKGEIGYYGSKMGVINLGITGSKDIKITDKFSLPVSVSLITNPQAEKVYLVAGISL